MVMHARKPQRISDGYFEKHQAHPYQKYNPKRVPNDYGASDNRYAPLRSPNGNVVHGHGGHALHPAHSAHAHHHYAHMVDEREYVTSRNSYMQKSSEIKERDRDYKSSRIKYTDVRSPKDKRSKESEREKLMHERCESEKKNRTSGMNSSVNRSNKYDKRSAPSSSMLTGSEWSEHISSSGKKYYYNCISEVSQWEKPPAVAVVHEWDPRRTSSKDSTYLSRGNCDKRSSSRPGRREPDKSNKRTNNTSDRYWNSGREEDGHDRTRPKRPMSQHDGKDGQSLQDMDISPDRSTPISENSYGAREGTSRSDANTVPPVVVLDNSNKPSGSLLAAALPRIVGMPQMSMQTAGPSGMCAGPSGMGAGPSSMGAGPSAANHRASPGSGAGTPHRDPGPPTPTHSENIDPHAPPIHLDSALPRKMECLGSYSSVVGSLHHGAPMLTPSLINYVRADLTPHAHGWPADILEKQANKFTEEAYQLGCLHCTRVSAELKCSRSIVRHTEIQATLQEQKLMYLRQQITRLEELKSQNSFMSED
ncbi:WW domain-containing adapter protein with coiled-coil homolog [Bicyclus anynana]|uniref:WW domain-containing adapter protein with coiled-coil homolog n=2 Tax=Satyrini TaxID=127320 RepID=A0ABM3M5P5_BICAN|nr:WW domain-containing adapter protein with coiled-coil homolog [Bicyclus anynana]